MYIGWKNDIMPCIINVIRLYVIDNVIKLKLASKWRQASPHSDISTNKSLN